MKSGPAICQRYREGALTGTCQGELGEAPSSAELLNTTRDPADDEYAPQRGGDIACFISSAVAIYSICPVAPLTAPLPFLFGLGWMDENGKVPAGGRCEQGCGRLCETLSLCFLWHVKTFAITGSHWLELLSQHACRLEPTSPISHYRPAKAFFCTSLTVPVPIPRLPLLCLVGRRRYHCTECLLLLSMTKNDDYYYYVTMV